MQPAQVAFKPGPRQHGAHNQIPQGVANETEDGMGRERTEREKREKKRECMTVCEKCI